jgi:hypothetical protein
LLRKIDRFVDLSEVRAHPGPYYMSWVAIPWNSTPSMTARSYANIANSPTSSA